MQKKIDPKPNKSRIPFVKGQGCGNDFILIDLVSSDYQVDWEKIAPALCDRHFGIGADGLLLIMRPEDPDCDFRMRIINSDGTEPQMCGNGIRVCARYIHEKGLSRRRQFAIETLAGVIRPSLVFADREFKGVKVDMGVPRLERSLIPMRGPEGQAISEPLTVGERVFHVTAVSMGNPHCVVFVDDDPQDLDLAALGPLLETHSAFPEKTNVEFARVRSGEAIDMRVWERGAGITLACGTGACATLVASALNGFSSRKALLHLAGGCLQIEWEQDDRVMMTGPAELVFSGTFEA